MQFVAMAVGLALVLTAGLATAQKGQKGQGMHGQGMQQGYGYGQMSPEQMQKAQDIYAEYSDTMYELRSQIFAKQQELAQALAGEEMNSDQVRSLTEEIHTLRGDLSSMRTEMYIEMREKDVQPYHGYGMMGQSMMGPGMMHGRGMMGPGMTHGGQGMGPGMMGSGMMHGGRGMGPGMMGPGMMYGGWGMGPGMGQGMMYGCPYQRY